MCKNVGVAANAESSSVTVNLSTARALSPDPYICTGKR